jgi:cold shock CspA family protein
MSEDSPRDRSSGSVKWFNKKAGYGFVSVTSDDYDGQDVFVHHSGLTMENKDQYRYLVEGEHVDFDWKKSSKNNHEWEAENVSGVNGAKLMCETRQNNRPPQNNQNHQNRQNSEVPNTYRMVGTGPREGEEWLLVRKQNYSGDRRSNRRNYNSNNEQ